MVESRGDGTINIDDLAATVVRLEVPGRVEGAPEVRAVTPRRHALPGQEEMPEDERQWVEVLGGGSNRERMWLRGVAAKAKELRDAGMAEYEAQLWEMAQIATFVADRVQAHNLVDAAGQPLPTGLDLVWELGYLDSLALVWNVIMNPPRLFASPKRERQAGGDSSTT